MIAWIRSVIAAERSKIAAGDVTRVEQRHLPLAIALGAAAGCAISYFFVLPVLLVFTAAGFGLGYAVRSYVSYRRRERFRRERDTRGF